MRSSEAVSVTVISYNAERTIEQTLDSIRCQDLGTDKIQLIISDDASIDDTVSVAGNWINRHSHEFCSTTLITHDENQGVSRNCNSAWKAATGEWIKTIAADDVLLPNCLSANLAFVRQHPDCSVLVSKMRWFGSVERVTPEPSQLPFFDLAPLDQFRYLRFNSFNVAPTSFIRRRALEDVGYADERFRHIEDWPLWLRFTRKDYKLYFNNCVTVKYRVADSISKSSSLIANVPFLLDIIAIHKLQSRLDSDGLGYKYLRFERSLSLYSKLLIIRLCGNRKSGLSRFLEGLALLLRPLDLMGVIRRRIGRLTQRTRFRGA